MDHLINAKPIENFRKVMLAIRYRGSCKEDQDPSLKRDYENAFALN
jgi:uncharacterized protein YihD (DUF1040 family)